MPEVWLLRIDPERRIGLTDYAPDTVARLGELFPEADVHRHDLLRDPPLEADVHMFHRIDTELYNDQWRDVYRRFAGQTILVVATGILPTDEIPRQILSAIRNRRATHAGWTRNPRRVRVALAQDAQGHSDEPGRPRGLGARAALNEVDHSAYSDARALVTGGLGFIGSHLAARSRDLGAEVTLDRLACSPTTAATCSTCRFEDRVRINIADVRGHGDALPGAGPGLLFNLAGQVSHIDSMKDPFTDLDINCTSQLWLLEALRKQNPELKSSSPARARCTGGRNSLPVDETTCCVPPT